MERWVKLDVPIVLKYGKLHNSFDRSQFCGYALKLLFALHIFRFYYVSNTLKTIENENFQFFFSKYFYFCERKMLENELIFNSLDFYVGLYIMVSSLESWWFCFKSMRKACDPMGHLV